MSVALMTGTLFSGLRLLKQNRCCFSDTTITVMIIVMIIIKITRMTVIKYHHPWQLQQLCGH